MGKTFGKESLSALSGVAPDDLEELLDSLVRKEVISLQSDPRSPDRGQYAFLQDLVRAVAYETLPKRDRKDKHLAVAGYLLQAWADRRGRDRRSRRLPLPGGVQAGSGRPRRRTSEGQGEGDDRSRAGERAAALAVDGRRSALLRAGARAHRRSARPGSLWKSALGRWHFWVAAQTEAQGAFRGRDLHPRDDRAKRMQAPVSRLGSVRSTSWRTGSSRALSGWRRPSRFSLTRNPMQISRRSPPS